MMSKLLSTLVIFIIYSLSTQAQWVRMDKINNGIGHVVFKDELNGFANSSSTNIITEDGGKTWKPYVSNLRGFSPYMYFYDSLEGYITNIAGLMKTTDGGNTWNVLIENNSTSIIEYQYLKKFSTGHFFGFEYRNDRFSIVKIAPNNKITRTPFRSNYQTEVFFADTLVYYHIQDNKIIKTIDGGISWATLGLGVNFQINKLYFTDALHGIAIGTDATIMHTANGGISWTKVSNQIGGFRYIDAEFTTDKVGYICGEQGIILKTTDGGLSWEKMNTGTFETLYSLSFPNSKVGYCAGENGILLKLNEDPELPQVTSISVPTGTLCAGAGHQISYTVNKKFATGNVFTAWLSDGLGDFKKGVKIGELVSDTSGTIAIQIPNNTTRNFGYRIRIQATKPEYVSATNNEFIEIQPVLNTSISIVSDKDKLCLNSSLALSSTAINAGNKPLINWYVNNSKVATGAKYTYTPKAKDKIWAVLRSSIVCVQPDSAVSTPIFVLVNEDITKPTEGKVIELHSPSKPVIDANGKILTSSSEIGNQWYFEEQAIVNAISNQYIADLEGSYKVQVNDGICPAQFSDAVMVKLNAIENSFDKQAIHLYPNPTNITLNIQSTRAMSKYIIYQSNGTKVLETKATESIDVSALPQGLYLLEAWDKNGTRILKKFEKGAL